jgi:tryptophan synthase alpha chain
MKSKSIALLLLRLSLNCRQENTSGPPPGKHQLAATRKNFRLHPGGRGTEVSRVPGWTCRAGCRNLRGVPNRIDLTFARLRETGGKAFIAYVAAGDPDFDRSLEVIRTLADSGADIIELGLPFSDPLADGIVNQMAADRALKSGMTTARALDLIRRFRETHETPIVLFTYLNPIFTYGFEQFHQDAAQAGADGILLLDLPPEEAAANRELAVASGLKPIRLIAPTTPDDRVKLLASSAEGFIYALSRTGVTGAHVAPSADIAHQVEKIRRHTTTPVCVGFGITTAEQAAMVAQAADGVIVGSAIVKQVELNPHRAADAVRDFVAPLIAAIR